MLVQVRDNNVEQAVKMLKKKSQRENIPRERGSAGILKSPPKKRARKKAEARRRLRKSERKRLEREGC